MQKEILQQTIDRHFKAEDEGLDECLQKEDMNGFWKLWSKALEKGYLEHLNETKEVNKKLMGRGKVTIVEKVPQRREMASNIEDIRKGGCKQAIKYLKQARRCEQVAYRLELINLQPEGPKVESYIALNTQALKKIQETAEETVD